MGRFRLARDIGPGTTHLVSGGLRTLKVLNAIAKGCWVLSKEWVFKSIEAKTWLPEADFELEQFKGAKVCWGGLVWSGRVGWIALFLVF